MTNDFPSIEDLAIGRVVYFSQYCLCANFGNEALRASVDAEIPSDSAEVKRRLKLIFEGNLDCHDRRQRKCVLLLEIF